MYIGKMKKIKLTAEERKIEKDLLEGVYKPVSSSESRDILEAVERKKRNTLLELRESIIDKNIIAKYEAREKNKKVRFYTAEEILKKQKSV